MSDSFHKYRNIGARKTDNAAKSSIFERKNKATPQRMRHNESDRTTNEATTHEAAAD
jgi:hypothetical protein